MYKTTGPKEIEYITLTSLALFLGTQKFFRTATYYKKQFKLWKFLEYVLGTYCSNDKYDIAVGIRNMTD